MELTYNNGTAFFYIESEDFVAATKDMKSVTRMISSDVISFSITEELGKLATGSLVLKDDSGLYARILRTGIRFKISWGYKKWNANLSSIGSGKYIHPLIRQGINCVVSSPSGGGNESGGTTYTITFYGEEILSELQRRNFSSGTRGSIIELIMRELGVQNYIIDFPTKRQRISTTNSIIQKDTNFSFIRYLSNIWGAYLLIGNDKNGKKIGIFVQREKMNGASVQKYIKSILGVENETYLDLYYNSGQLSNTKTFTWSQNIGENGSGDSVTVNYVDGQPIFIKRVMEEGRIVSYKLNVDKVKTEMRKKGNIQDEIIVYQQIANTTDFNKVKHIYFDSSIESTAPQGAGFTVNASIHGDPFAIVMKKVNFKGGFPPPLTQGQILLSPLIFYIKRATHTFTKGEYNTELEIVDTFSLTGSYIAPEKADFRR